MSPIKKQVIEANIDNIENVLSVIKEQMVPREYEKILDSQLMTEGVVFFNHEFGPARLKRAFALHTYFFLNLMEECGRLWRLYQNQPVSTVRMSPVGSIICTMAVLEYRDIAFTWNEILEEKEAKRVVNGLINEFLPHVELASHIRQAMREHFEKFKVNGVYVSKVNKLRMDVIDQGRKPLYVVR